MTSIANRRTLALACALIGRSLLQGCAVTTGPFHPSRSAISNASMTSRYDVLRQQSTPSGTFQMRTVNDRHHRPRPCCPVIATTVRALSSSSHRRARIVAER